MNKKCIKDFFGIVYHQEMINEDLCAGFFSLLQDLSEKEYTVLSYRYGLEDGKTMSLSEVANYFKVTEERIKNVEITAIKKLRHPSRSKVLLDKNKSDRVFVNSDYLPDGTTWKDIDEKPNKKPVPFTRKNLELIVDPEVLRRYEELWKKNK